MCIALISTAHPSYSLILIANRDEYLNRPTDRARWWPDPHPHVLGGRDMLRDIRGTWLGVTRQGKIAALTNYREDTTPPPSAVSRGAIIKEFLSQHVGPVEDFVENVVNSGIARDAGGFSLVCGNIGEKLAVVSNRAADQSQVPWIAGDVVQTVGLSNASFTDRSWTKVTRGEELMLDAIRQSLQSHESEDELLQRFLRVLSCDTLPRQAGASDEGGLETHIMQLRDTIYVPTLGRKDMTGLTDDELRAARKNEKLDIVGHDTPVRNGSPSHVGQRNTQQLGVSGVYGTQKHTIVLADKNGNVRFFERTLFDENSDPIPPGRGDVDVRFQIEKP